MVNRGEEKVRVHINVVPRSTKNVLIVWPLHFLWHGIKQLCNALMRYILYYYMEESVLLGTKPLVDSIRHFIRDPGGVFSVCHLCKCRIVQ